MGLGKKKSKSRREIPQPPPPPPDDSTATTATTIAESVAESSAADTSIASSIAPPPATTVPADTNNNTSVAESIAPDMTKPPPPPAFQPAAPDESFAQQRKLGYMSTTGKYGDVAFYNKTRSDYLRIGNFEKVKVVDAAWAEKCRQDKLGPRAWPPKKLFCRTYFWTCGHYKWWSDRYARALIGGVPSSYQATEVTQVTESKVEETVVTEKRHSKSKEGKRLSKSTDEKRLSKSEETKTAEATKEEEVVMDTLLITKVSKKKSSRKIGKDKSGIVKEKSGIVKEKSGLVKQKSGRIVAEPAPERGRRSVDEAAPQKPPDETPTPSVAVPETPLKVNNFSTHRLHVANIPMDIKLEAVQKLFKGGAVDLYPDPAGTQMLATVKYEAVKDAHKAFQNNKKAKLGGRPLVVSPKLREE